MKKFLKEALPELKKDLFKDVVKYILVAILSVIGIWLLKKINPLNAFLRQEVTISYYILIIIIIIAIITSSFLTFIFQNQKYQRLKKDSLTDELTGLFNHKALPIKLKTALDSSRKEKKTLSLILFDIDDFKKINENHLMKGGDRVMEQIGAYLSADSRANDILCRQHVKGDEFILIATNTNKDQARMAAERKRKEIEESEFQVSKSGLIKVTVSCGVAEYDVSADTVDSLIEKANKALLIAKGMGKNKTILYEGGN